MFFFNMLARGRELMTMGRELMLVHPTCPSGGYDQGLKGMDIPSPSIPPAGPKHPLEVCPVSIPISWLCGGEHCARPEGL